MYQKIATYYIRAGELLKDNRCDPVERQHLSRITEDDVDEIFGQLQSEVRDRATLIDGAGETFVVNKLDEETVDRLSEVLYQRSEGNVLVVPDC